MVLLSFALYTASAIAIHINNAVLGEAFVVHHACEGETFCSTKPHNYPQEEIDRLVIKHLPQLHRMKRDAAQPRPAAPYLGEGNCHVKAVTTMKPFTLNPRYKDQLPQLLVQSQWFEQEVPTVTCSNDKHEQCFNEFDLHHSKNGFQCHTRRASSKLFLYDPDLGNITSVSTNIDVGCGCNNA